MAETATSLYRETSYSNLIDFEEDIACIASVVLLIAESAGSLAELGAFAALRNIQSGLRVLIQQEHYDQESFVRFGPIDLSQKLREDHVGVFPWRVRKDGSLIKSSVEPHYRDMIKFISGHVDRAPKTTSFSSDERLNAFITIYWILHIFIAAPLGVIEDHFKAVLPDYSGSKIKDLIYCMKIAGWIADIKYSGQTYYYAKIDFDPFDYRFKSTAQNKDGRRWKFQVADSLKKDLALPRHVRRVAAENKRPAT